MCNGVFFSAERNGLNGLVCVISGRLLDAGLCLMCHAAVPWKYASIVGRKRMVQQCALADCVHVLAISGVDPARSIGPSAWCVWWAGARDVPPKRSFRPQDQRLDDSLRRGRLGEGCRS